MSELIPQIGAGVGIMIALAVASFRIGLRRGNGGMGTAPRWHHEDRELVRGLRTELSGLREHLDDHASAIGELRSSIDQMLGFLQGRFSAPPGD